MGRRPNLLKRMITEHLDFGLNSTNVSNRQYCTMLESPIRAKKNNNIPPGSMMGHQTARGQAWWSYENYSQEINTRRFYFKQKHAAYSAAARQNRLGIFNIEIFFSPSIILCTWHILHQVFIWNPPCASCAVCVLVFLPLSVNTSSLKNSEILRKKQSGTDQDSRLKPGTQFV